MGLDQLITVDLYNPIDFVDNAAKRLPEGVLRVTEPTGEYDLIVATGIFYQHYDFRKFLDIIKKHAKGTVLLSNIKAWEVPEVAELGTPIHVEEYPYREYTQILRIYEFQTFTQCWGY